MLEGVAENIRCVQRRDLQHVDDQLHQQQLDDEGHVVFILHQQEVEILVERVRVLHQQIPKGRDEYGQQQHQRADDLKVRAD